MRPVFLVAVFAGCLGVVVSAAGQSLADVARNAEAARNASPARPHAKIYTNKDLSTVDHVVPAPTNSSPAATSPAPPAPADGPAAADVKGEAYWRDRMRPLRERLDSVRALADDT